MSHERTPSQAALPKTGWRCVLVGSGTLTAQCGQHLLSRGHQILRLVTRDAAVREWGEAAGLEIVESPKKLSRDVELGAYDFLFSIANLEVLPQQLVDSATRHAINFHDGPLPRYAGLYAPAWALIHQEQQHGITWHLMTDEVDKGDLLLQRSFDLRPDETSLSLNAACYEHGMNSFTDLVAGIESGSIVPQQQPDQGFTYFGLEDRPAAACVVDWSRPTSEVVALLRALDFGNYDNPLGTAKIRLGSSVYSIKHFEVSEKRPEVPPGTRLDQGEGPLEIATADGALRLTEVHGSDGCEVTPEAQHAPNPLSEDQAQLLTDFNRSYSRYESRWLARLSTAIPLELPCLNNTLFANSADQPSIVVERAIDLDALASSSDMTAFETCLAVISLFLSRTSSMTTFDLDLSHPELANSELRPFFASFVPLRVKLEEDSDFAHNSQRVIKDLRRIRRWGSYALDIRTRRTALRGQPRPPRRLQIVDAEALEDDALLALAEGGDLTIAIRSRSLSWIADPRSLDQRALNQLIGQFETLRTALVAKPQLALKRLPLLDRQQRQRILVDWNRTETDVDLNSISGQFERQASLTPDADAVCVRGKSLSYRELNARANQLAHYLREIGVEPEKLVGIALERSLDLVVAVLAVLKAGGAYVPLDPAYPKDRLRYMLEDAGLAALLTTHTVAARLDPHQVPEVCLDTSAKNIATLPEDNLPPSSRPEHLAYVIYTSGSTGRPKGVMVEQRNVANFFTGMDRIIPVQTETQPVWLAVTSLSFDISVLELLWTLCRGFKVVVYTNDDWRNGAPSLGARQARSAREMQFSLFYFSADESASGTTDKYRLLLDGARFADTHGFSAVWTPERHFHAFGGLYPNPSVTGAAIAAITKRLRIRAGSCVLPLHHPVRVAEEWSVVDNISGGRVGISVAAGWQPNDFIIRPEAYAEAKRVMLDQLDVVRRLWRGEAVRFENPKGDPVDVRILPRPVQKELPVWLTAAGNPQTFAAAGRSGANILTHLLGQTLEELSEKLTIYRQARREAGHPGPGHATLMLHTLVGDSDAEVKELVREPMTAYLRSSVGLIKQYAWSFPTFKNQPSGNIDLNQLSTEEMNALLAHSFERYYETSGLFGTIERCEEMVERLKAIHVDEIACLIDFGVPADTVTKHLSQLNALRQITAAGATQPTETYSIAALIPRHNVTHMQCTPSMAAMMVADPTIRAALQRLPCMLVGGEALSTDLAHDLESLGCQLHNMYGPTETTIWSATDVVDPTRDAVTIGRAIANTSLLVLDRFGQPVPPGVPGELYIGGNGVVRGYLKRPDLTAERFISSPIEEVSGRFYRTGDLVRYHDDGRLDFMGRLDHQVKLRGYRIELGEIEAALRDQPSVDQAVVVVREDRPGDKRLVAYVTPKQEGQIGDLRQRLLAALPEFMVPSQIVSLENLPLTPNAKVDRKALPSPDSLRLLPTTGQYVAPSSSLENQVAELWRELLKIDRVGVDDNFFDLGGHSLLAVQALMQLKTLPSPKPLSLTDLFRFPTIRSLCAFLGGEGQGQAAKAGMKRGQARRRLRQARGRAKTGTG